MWTCQVEHLGLEGDDAVVDAVPTTVREAATPAEAFTTGERAPRRLADFDVVLMRKDPPVDVDYLHATWILDHARGKTLLVNDPRGLRELNEHLAVLRFPHLTPPTIVTRSPARLRAFQAEQGGAIVVKPVDGFGGLGIFVVRDGDPNASSILETSTGAGTRWTIAQRYLPEATEGDKRIVLVDGEPIGAVLRVPASAEARGNLHVGGPRGQDRARRARSPDHRRARAVPRAARPDPRRPRRDRRHAHRAQHHVADRHPPHRPARSAQRRRVRSSSASSSSRAPGSDRRSAGRGRHADTPDTRARDRAELAPARSLLSLPCESR